MAKSSCKRCREMFRTYIPNRKREVAENLVWPAHLSTVFGIQANTGNSLQICIGSKKNQAETPEEKSVFRVKRCLWERLTKSWKKTTTGWWHLDLQSYFTGKVFPNLSHFCCVTADHGGFVLSDQRQVVEGCIYCTRIMFLQQPRHVSGDE